MIIDCFEDVYIVLDSCKFIQNNNRQKLAENQGGYSCPVGLCYDYVGRWTEDKERGYRIPRFDEVNGEEVFNAISKFIDEYCKKKNIDFKFNALTINKNFKCGFHRDQNNIGESLVFCVGDYIDGRLILRREYENEDFDEYIDIHNKPIIFKANEILHKTEDFKADRYCIVAYWI